MKKQIYSITLATLLLATLTGCSEKVPEPKKEEFDQRCKVENVLAPQWTCIPTVEEFYAGVGISEKSAAGMAHMRRVALANGRSDLAQQIQIEVKNKIELFTRSTGISDSESIDKVSTSVTKQVAKVNLKSSKAVNSWSAPSGTLYLLVTVSEKSVNNTVKKSLKSSFKDDNALWQQFQSKQALESLDKEFPSN